MDNKIYGVSQSFHGHEYKYLFDAETLKKELGYVPEDGACEDIRFPIGGSNSSATFFEELKNDDEIKGFLTTCGEPDYEDPQLVDIAEYLMTISTEEPSCTAKYLDKFGLKAQDLEQYDDCYKRGEKIEKMAKELKKYDTEFDCDNPFYGDNRNMTYGEFCEFYESVTGKKVA